MSEEKPYTVEYVCGCGYREVRLSYGFGRQEWPHDCPLSKDAAKPS